MKRLGMLFVLVAALAINLPSFAAPPAKAHLPTSTDVTGTSPSFNFGDVAENDLAIFVGPDGNLNVVDRSFTELPGRDLAFEAFASLMERHPDVVQQWFTKVVRPQIGVYKGSVLTGATTTSSRAINDTIRQLARNELRPLLENASARMPSWYQEGPTLAASTTWASVVCSPCGAGEKPAKSCGSLCASDCAGRSGNCAKIIVVGIRELEAY